MLYREYYAKTTLTYNCNFFAGFLTRSLIFIFHEQTNTFLQWSLLRKTKVLVNFNLLNEKVSEFEWGAEIEVLGSIIVLV